jgi:hypothetical protein
MKHYEISRNVELFDIVALRGNKFIRCSSKARPMGVWTPAYTIQVMTLDGESHTFLIPQGVQNKGYTQARIKEI